jgi:predicted negative regulator of RcsB-dependent stress response
LNSALDDLEALPPALREEISFAVEYYRGEALRLLVEVAGSQAAYEKALEACGTLKTKDNLVEVRIDTLWLLGRKKEATRTFQTASKKSISKKLELMQKLRMSDVDGTLRVTGRMRNSPSSILDVLCDPEFSDVFSDARVRRAFVDAVAAQNEILTDLGSSRIGTPLFG